MSGTRAIPYRFASGERKSGRDSPGQVETHFKNMFRHATARRKRALLERCRRPLFMENGLLLFCNASVNNKDHQPESG